jgi:hypothetical protein
LMTAMEEVVVHLKMVMVVAEVHLRLVTVVVVERSMTAEEVAEEHLKMVKEVTGQRSVMVVVEVHLKMAMVVVEERSTTAKEVAEERLKMVKEVTGQLLVMEAELVLIFLEEATELCPAMVVEVRCWFVKEDVLVRCSPAKEVVLEQMMELVE